MSEVSQGPSLPNLHIVLIGMMGSGKTTVGRFLAAQLGWPLVDLDTMLIAEMGMSISDAFALHGEPWFREQESAKLLEVLRRESAQVLSPGGGVVLSADNRTALANHARTVWLRATPETIVKRVGSALGRPLLAANPEERVRRIDAERAPLYAQTAGVVIDVDDLSTPQVVECIRAVFTDLH